MPKPTQTRRAARDADAPLSAAALTAFYKTPRGKTLAADALSFIKAAWGPRAVSNLHFMCFGFPAAGLHGYVKSARSFALLTPSFTGAVPWREGNINKSAVVDEVKFAVRAACFDRVLVFHTIEGLEDPASFIEEIWRVTAPGGRAIFLLPKGKGLMAPTEFKAFIAGKGFMPSGQGGALFGLSKSAEEKPRLAKFFRAFNPASGLFGAAYFLIEAEKRQDNFGAEKTPVGKPIRARPIPS